MNVAIVIPAFNERERLPPFLASIQERFANVADYEVIVVDDGSVDGSSEYLKDLSGHWPQLKCVRFQENRGKGAAVRAGVLASDARLVLVSDADGAAPIDELAPMIAILDSGADIVCGSRMAGPNVRRGVLRRVASVAFSVVVRSIVGSKVRDTQCRFKLFRDDVARRFFRLSAEDGWISDLEILILADRFGLRVEEAPVRWTEMPGSRVRVVRDGVKMLLGALRLPAKIRRRLDAQGSSCQRPIAPQTQMESPAND